MSIKTSRTRVISAVLAALLIFSFGLPMQPGWAAAPGSTSAPGGSPGPEGARQYAAPKPTPAVPSQILSEKIDPSLLAAIKNKPNANVSVIIYMTEQTDFSQAGFASTDASLTELKAQRDQVYETLTSTAKDTQAPVLSLLQGQANGGKALSTDVESFWIFNGVGATVFPNTINELAALPDVERIYLDEEITIPPDEMLAFKGTSDASAYGNWGIAKIRADKVWSDLKIDGTGVVVGIVDTGVAREHSALTEKYRGNHTYHVYSFRDFVGEKLAPYDDQGHGTHVTGIIVGSTGDDNNRIGVAPGAEWIAAKALDAHGSALSRAMLRAMQWIQAPEGIASLAPDVINNSWSFRCSNDFFRSAVKSWRAAGIIPVFSAGNGGPGEATIRQPACFPEVIAVGATDSDDKITSFSSRGPSFNTITKPDLTAPGLNIRSSVPAQDYEAYSGTSMATPFVTGVIALMLQANPSLSMDQVLNTLRSTSVDLGAAGADNEYGWGRIDAYNAVRGENHDPGALTLLAPTGAVTETQPAYQWEPLETAVRYQLRVRSQAGQDIVAAWYRAADSCSDTACSVQPSKTLEKGAYVWQIQVEEAASIKPWSEEMSFTVGDSAPLTAPTLLFPAGDIAEISPTYVWSPVSAATKYQIKVSASDAAEVLSAWYDAKSVCTAEKCQVKTTTNLESGDFTWQVQAANDGASGEASTAMAFHVGSPAPAAPEPASPVGDTQSASPEFRWQGVTGATKYQLKVSDSSAKEIIASWYQGTDVCSAASCVVKTNLTLEPGSYTWQIQAADDSASSLWSKSLSFRLTAPASGPETLAPSGEITETQPAYQWKAAQAGSDYKLKVIKADGEVLLATWYTDDTCASGVCTVKPALKLPFGDYSWQVQATGASGVSPWSKITAFRVAEALPGSAKPIAPSGTIRETQPTFQWNAVEGAKEYRLKVSGASGDALRTWFKTQDVCSGETCTVKPALTLAAGSYAWQVQTSGELCGSAWSAEMPFVVEVSSPAASLPLLPAGSITDSQPAFRWNAADGAGEYHLKISDAAGKTVYDKWFRSGDFCKDKVCSAKISATLTSGEYAWQIQPSSQSGDGAWSEALRFTLQTLPPPAPSATSPSGNLEVSQPVFQWAVQADASAYEFRLDDAAGKPILLESYQAEDVCSSTLCSIKGSHTIPVGKYAWKVRAANAAGSGPWSAPVSFSLNAPLPSPLPQDRSSQPAQNYVVKAGDSLAILARSWGVELEKLAELNQIVYPYILRVGQELIIPGRPSTQNTPANPASRVYTIQNGDHLMSLARAWNVAWEEIVKTNGLKYPYTLIPGEILLRP